MGYYTRFSLSYELPETNRLAVDEMIKFLETELVGRSVDKIKWYEYRTEMLCLSDRFPQILFILSGEGEESGDVWKEYYKGGKCQRSVAKLVFEPFDENKLC